MPLLGHHHVEPFDDVVNDVESTQNRNLRHKRYYLWKLINRIPGLCLSIPSLQSTCWYIFCCCVCCLAGWKLTIVKACSIRHVRYLVFHVHSWQSLLFVLAFGSPYFMIFYSYYSRHKTACVVCFLAWLCSMMWVHNVCNICYQQVVYIANIMDPDLKQSNGLYCVCFNVKCVLETIKSICSWQNKHIRIHHECEDGIGKSIPRITAWHQEACGVMTKVIPRGGFFYSTLTQLLDSFSCSPLDTTFMLKKGSQKFLNRLRCYMLWWRHFNITVTSVYDHVRELN